MTRWYPVKPIPNEPDFYDVWLLGEYVKMRKSFYRKVCWVANSSHDAFAKEWKKHKNGEPSMIDEAYWEDYK